jgi:hypothetical protein
MNENKDIKRMKNMDKLFDGFRELLLAYWALKYGLLQSLCNSSRSIEFLSDSSGIPVDRLTRLLRGLCWRNILKPGTNGSIEITELGKQYLSESEEIMFQGDFFLKQWTFLDGYFEGGQHPCLESQGELIFDSLDKDQRLGEVFVAPWAERASEYAKAISEHPAFLSAKEVVDVGGAEGKLLGDLLSIHKHINGIVFDLPYCRSAFEKQPFDFKERIKFQAGSFFEKVPENKDIYILKWILHDWDDENAVAILAKCAEAMHYDSKLFIIERIVSENFQESIRFAKADLNMLALNSGRERTEKEFHRLLEKGNISYQGKFEFSNNPGFTIIEGKKSE